MKLGLGCCCDESSSDESSSDESTSSVSTFSGSTIDTDCDATCEITPRYWDVEIPELDTVETMPYHCLDWVSGDTHPVQSVGSSTAGACEWHFYPTPKYFAHPGEENPITPEICETSPYRCYVIWSTRCGPVEEIAVCTEPPHTAKWRTDAADCRDQRTIFKYFRGTGECLFRFYRRATPTPRVPCYSSGTIGANAIHLTLKRSGSVRTWTVKARKTAIGHNGNQTIYRVWDHGTWSLQEPVDEPCAASKTLTQTGIRFACDGITPQSIYGDYMKFPAGSTVTITPRGSKY